MCFLDVGGDGDWSVQACRQKTHGFQSWHQDSQVSPVSEGGRGEGGMGGEGGLQFIYNHVSLPVVTLA